MNNLDADQNEFKRGAARVLGVKPLPFKDPLVFQSGEDPELPPWREAVAKHLISGKEEDAAAALRLIRGRRTEIHCERENLMDEMFRMNMRIEVQNWVDWAEKSDGWHLQPATTSVWHKVRDAYGLGRIMHGRLNEAEEMERVGTEFSPFFAEEPHVFLVQHDWAAAFNGATDFDAGEIRMPFDNCAFEMLLNGKRLLCLLAGERLAVVSDVGKGFWLCSAWTTLEDMADTVRYGTVAKTIRALCIALDAEVVVTDVVRAPHRLNHARERQGKKPINDHHIINLARRSRVAPLAGGEMAHEPRWHPRLHFRRGHWRHFENHKTWIRWMLVGNPDLGFIDHDYRA